MEAAAAWWRMTGLERSEAGEVPVVVAEEMAEAREMGMRQRPFPCRYCMAVPMSSSIIFATCCSVTRIPVPPPPPPLSPSPPPPFALAVAALLPPPLLLFALLFACTTDSASHNCRQKY
jgi:hypothetical protein